jgi:ribonuclease E
MAQAVVDLPDQPDPATDSLAKTDELLSELVGNDIDRLLADAAADAPPAPAAPASPDATIHSQLDDLFNELQTDIAPPAKDLNAKGESAATSSAEKAALLQAPEASATTEPAPAAAEPAKSEEASLTSQLDDLFNELQTDIAPPAAQKSAATETKPEPAPPLAVDTKEEPAATAGAEKAALLQAAGFDVNAAPAAAQPGATAAPISASPDPVHETAPAGSERSALLEAAGFESNPNAPSPQAGPVAKPPADQLEPPADNAPLPLYLKPLVWVNLPFRTCPDALRQSLGQAAIVTLLFAMAVLGYVAMHPRH